MQPNLIYIKETLTNTLSPTFLEVMDESHKHEGHGGYHPDGSHFAVTIASPAFANKSLVECHQLVYEALGTRVGKEIHAISIHIKRESK